MVSRDIFVSLLKVQQERNSARLYVGDTSVGSSIIHRSSIYFIYLVHFGVSSQKTSNQTLVTRTSRCKECTVENKYDTGISFLRKYFFSSFFFCRLFLSSISHTRVKSCGRCSSNIELFQSFTYLRF